MRHRPRRKAESLNDLGPTAPNGYTCTVPEDGVQCDSPAAWHVWVPGSRPRRCVRTCEDHRGWPPSILGEHPLGLACAVNGAFWQGDHCVLPDEDYRELTKNSESSDES
jgi:hypothetical protein